jgi:hypothetical protein
MADGLLGVSVPEDPNIVGGMMEEDYWKFVSQGISIPVVWLCAYDGENHTGVMIALAMTFSGVTFNMLSEASTRPTIAEARCSCATEIDPRSQSMPISYITGCIMCK